MIRPSYPSCPCACCHRQFNTDMGAWYEEQRRLDREKYDPSRFRPDAIKRNWREVLRQHGDPRYWKNGPMRRAAEIPRLSLRELHEVKPEDKVEYATFDFRYSATSYRGCGNGDYRVHSVTCDGIRVWEQIERL